MEYAIIGIIIVAAIAASMMIFLKTKKTSSGVVAVSVGSDKDKAEVQLVPADSDPQELVIQMEMLPAECKRIKDRLF